MNDRLKLRQKQLDAMEQQAGSLGKGQTTRGTPKPAEKPATKTMSYQDFFYPKAQKATAYKAGGMVKGKKKC